jgi:glycosyltransferase involved in cell wall biosynthesis
MVRTHRFAIVTSIHSDFNVRIWKHATAVAAAGHEVHLICPWAVADGEVREGVVLHPFKRAGSRLQRFWQIPARVLPRVFRLAPRVDLIHFHDFDLLPLLAPLALYRPMVYDVHENYPEEMLVKYWLPRPLRKPASLLTKWGQFLLALMVRNVVLVVPSQEAAFPSKYIRRVEVRNYASRELVKQIADDYDRRPDTVIFTGTQYESNGTLLLLEIAAKIREERAWVRFLVTDLFANEQQRREYLERVALLDLQDTVRVVPAVHYTRMMELLNQATIGIAPMLGLHKHRIGLPTKMIEYMAAGLPVVTSDLPIKREIIEETGAGLLAKAGDVESFANAICRLVDDRSYARRLGENGRKAVWDSYCWESQMAALLSFYDEILGEEAVGGKRLSTEAERSG